MKTMKKMMTVLAVAGLVLALAPAAQADATWTNGVGDGVNWSDNDNWDVADITTAGGTFTLTGSGSTTVNTNTTSWGIAKLTVSATDTINIGPGATATLKTTGDYSLSGSTLIQTGGTVNMTGIKNGDMGQTQISGGSYFASQWRQAYINSAGPQLQITGTNATSIQVSSFLTQLYSGRDLVEISYTLEAGGVTPLKVSVMGDASNIEKLTINVDGIENYTGPNTPIPLFIDINSAINNSGVIEAGTITGGNGGILTLGTTTTTDDTIFLTILGAPSVWEVTGAGNWNTEHWTVGSTANQTPGTSFMTVDTNGSVVTVTDNANCVALAIGENNTSTVSIDATKTLTVAGYVSVGASGTLNVNGTLDTPTLNTAGVTTLDGAETIGTLNVTGGALSGSSSLTVNTLSINGGNVSVPAITASNPINLTGPATVGAALGGAVAMNMLGGTVTLTNANSFSGVTISGGILEATDADSLGSGTVTFNANGSTLSLLNNTSTDYGNDINTPVQGSEFIIVGSDGSAIPSQVHELGNITTDGGNHTLTVTGNEGYGLTLGAISVNKNYTINNNSDGLLTIASVGPAGGNRFISFNGTGTNTVSGSVTLSSPTTGAIKQNGVGLTTLEGNVIGDIRAYVGTLTLDGSYQLDIEGDGTDGLLFEQITGDAGDDETLNLNGSFDFDVTVADETLGNTWLIVDTNTIFAVNYDAGFVVTGATSGGGAAGSRVWSFAAVNPELFFEFRESDGVLEVVLPPPPAGTVLIVK